VVVVVAATAAHGAGTNPHDPEVAFAV